MARPSLPTLTWAHTAVISQTNCTMQQCLDHIRTLLGTTTYWEDFDAATPTDPAANAFAYVIAKPKAGSAAPLQRVTIGFRGTSAFTAGSMGVYHDNGSRLAVNVLDTNELGFNYQPEGGATFTAADRVDPFATKRSLGWYPCTQGGPLFGGVKTINIYLIESDEILCLCIEDASSATEEQFGFQCGPMWVGATDQAGDVDATAAVADRIWGFSSWPKAWYEGFAGLGGNLLTDCVWTSYNNSSNGQHHRNCCFDPANPTLGLQLGGGGLPVCANASAAPQLGALDQFISQTGAYVGFDVNFVAFNGLGHVLADPKYLGVWRQIRFGGTPGPGRFDVNSGGGLRAITRCSSGNSALHDTLWYTNS